MRTDVLRTRIWFAVMAAMVVLLVWQLQRGPEFSTNILDLLPEDERDPVITRALADFTDRMTARHLFLVGAPDRQAAATAASLLLDRITASGLFEEVVGRFDGDAESQFYQLYHPYRAYLMSDTNADMLAAPDASARVIKGIEAKLYSPLSSMYSRMMAEDPLLLFPDFLGGLPKPPGALQIREGYLSAERDGRVYILISAVCRGAVMDRKAQRDLRQFLADATQDLTTNPEISLHQAGFVRYAARAAEAAEQETTTIGAGSFLGVVALMLLVFRSVRPLLLGVLPILAGLTAATAVCLTVFGGLHMITLGFGAALIGVCIDYTFHYFCEAMESDGDGPHVLRAVLPGLTLGSLTSMLGYLGLLIAPFPGLRQMALFSTVGLVTATLTVVCCFPAWARHGEGHAPAALNLARGYMNLWIGARSGTVVLVFAGLVLVAGAGLSRLETDDDIRSLHKAEADLFAEEQFIKDLAGNPDGGRFLLVEGASAEAVLRREETLRSRLDGLVASGDLVFYQALSMFLPSAQKQTHNNGLLRDLADQEALAEGLFELGYDQDLIQAVKGLGGTDSGPLTLPQWLDHPASTHLRHLWLGETTRGFASLIVLGGVEADAVRALEGDGVRYVDRVGSLSDLMGRYRVLAAGLTLASYLVILLVLVFRYGLKKGLVVMVPPVVSALTALAVFGLLGNGVNLFNVLSLLLVLGIGIDYTIFFAESAERSPTTMLAIMMSACTTLLSFGLLALSQTPVLSSFGAVVLVGIAASMLLSPAVLRVGRLA